MQPRRTPIEHLEQIAAGGHYAQAERFLMAFSGFEIADGFDDSACTGQAEKIADNVSKATRVASAIAALLADPHCKLSERGAVVMASNLPWINALFRLSEFGSHAHLAELIQAAVGSPLGFSRAEIARIVLAASVYGTSMLEFPSLMKQVPDLAVRAYLGALNTVEYLTDQAEANRSQLLGLRDALKDIELPDDCVVLAVNVWMNCSYALDEDKHLIKPVLNGMLRRWAIRKGAKEIGLAAKPKPKNRPTLLVPLEHMAQVHAMYRCYAPYLRALGQHFKVIGMGEPQLVDRAGQSLFSGYIEVKDPLANVGSVAAKALRVNPDAIFYPSVGMRPWTTALANLRLAPMQFSALGHPASTHIPTMDYMLIAPLQADTPEEFTETVVAIKDFGFSADRPDIESYPTPIIREKPETVVVAVPSSLPKINHRFLDACRSIAAKSKKKVTFRFFPTADGIVFQQARKLINDIIPGAEVIPTLAYRDYMGVLNECDIRLGTFPFGGCNTNVDSYVLGIPTVILSGRHVHSKTDRLFMRQMDVPAWLDTETEEDYVAAAVRLIDDDAERVRISRLILDRKPAERLLQSGDPEGFAAAIRQLYVGHCENRWLGQKVIKL